jgi:hypothetical protein
MHLVRVVRRHTYRRTHIHVHATTYMLRVRPEKRLIRDDSEGRPGSSERAGRNSRKGTAIFVVRNNPAESTEASDLVARLSNP